MYRRLQKLLNTRGEVFDQREIIFIVEHTYKIALNYLKYSYLRVQKLIDIYEISYEDIAIDSIAPLFVKNKDDVHLLLVNSFKNWKPPIKNEEDALFFLNKIVAARVEQHIALLLREVDPVFGKILDSVNYFVGKGGFNKINYLGYLYIVERDCSLIQGKVIDPIDFEYLPLNLFYNKQTALMDILDYIKTEGEYFPAVPLIAFVSRIKRLIFLNINEMPELEFFFNRIEIEECINHGLNQAKSKLNTTYKNTKKLTMHECNIVEKVLNEIALDLRNGGIHSGMHEYFINYMPELSKEEFNSKYKNIIEYLYKSMRGSIAAKLKN